MAVIQNPLIGRARKSVGSVTFSTWRGLNVARTKPVSVNQKLTVAVIENRAKQSLVAKYVSKMRNSLAIIYDLGIQGTTPFADTIKFLRNKLLDTTKFDASLFANTSFGTGNQPPSTWIPSSSQQEIITLDLVNSNVNPLFTSVDADLYIFVIDQYGDKYACYKKQGIDDATQIDFDVANKFISGDYVACGYKLVRRMGGINYSSKVYFPDFQSFFEIA